MSDKMEGLIIVRTWREADGGWFASAEAAPPSLSRYPPGDTVVHFLDGRRWPLEVSAITETQAAAVLEAVKRLLARGLGPLEGERQ